MHIKRRDSMAQLLIFLGTSSHFVENGTSAVQKGYIDFYEAIVIELYKAIEIISFRM